MIIQIGMTICSSHGIKTQEIKGKLSILSHVQLNGLLENTQIVFTFIDGYMKPAFYFEIPRDTNRYNITTMNILYHIIRIILSVGTILTLIRNEKIYQAYKHSHPTNKIRYIISQLIILTLYTSSLILVSYTYRIILRYI